MQLREWAVEILSLLSGVPAELAHALQAMRSPSELADISASLLDPDLADKQRLPQTLDAEERLQKVLDTVSRRIEVLRISQEIGDRTKEKIPDHERRCLPREQLKTIEKELGHDSDDGGETAKLEEAIARAGMPEDVAAEAGKELARLRRMGPSSPESAALTTWLERMTSLPWTIEPEAGIDFPAARARPGPDGNPRVAGHEHGHARARAVLRHCAGGHVHVHVDALERRDPPWPRCSRTGPCTGMPP